MRMRTGEGKEAMNGFADIHCHILPGVDDGAGDMTQAMTLLRMAYQDGIRAMILTPHYRGRFKKNPTDRLRAQYDALCQTAKSEFPDLKLYLGNEAHWETELPERLEEGRVLTLGGSDYCLLEFSTRVLRSLVISAVAEVQRCGFAPVIAHAERYEVFRKDRELLDEVLHMGAFIQLNADSVMGAHGFGVRQFCKRVLKEQKAHFVASDAHDEVARPPHLAKCHQWVCKKYGEDYAARLFWENAQAVIENTLL